ncbi:MULTISPECIES: UPF0058 family protein [Methanohalophilus]|uniref:Metal-binding protein n=3 Tax=Methanohalophilus TaxID=2175 RepID=A0A1L3Q1I2_9EURY|nr:MULTISPECIES: UPF0058 family protein [Methanohalophilus]APH38710.1 metal-binding protein [Methanohalophilus halophilus]ATU09069.1 metal-binding protein [Methanohalophilus portucalensis]OJH48498.1 hypothetical protein MPF_1968 [Methanohalophilus portucalensis FDF-1]RNI08290.1 UPF0058 family protein [Methanohalophilus halophilus]RNI12520.1 UPF0058 family protein [Methanohalophilus portucalensis FDF-1]
MHKDELIQLHTLMAQIKRYLEDQGVEHDFEDYNSLSISPVHIHRSKAEHKHAIFILGNHLASIISEDEISSVSRTSIRMQEFAERSGHGVSHSN